MPKTQPLELPARETKGLPVKILTLASGFLKKVEHLGSRSKWLGRLYYHLFYRKMIDRELAITELSPRAKVIHVGSGPLPLTVYSLTGSGFDVEALDNDPGAVKRANRLLKKMNPGSGDLVRGADGVNLDCGSAEAVWISLNVIPKHRVLKKVFSSLKQGGKLVYRNPRGLLSLVYPRVEAESIAPFCPVKRAKQSLGKETLVITKTPAPGYDECTQAATACKRGRGYETV